MSALAEYQARQAAIRAAVPIHDKHRGWVRARVARKRHRCICADPVYPWWNAKAIHSRDADGSVTGYAQRGARQRSEAEEAAADMARLYPGDEIEIFQTPNPNHAKRAEGCTGDIAPGEGYGEYIGDSAFYESGSAYCTACCAAAWGSDPKW